jgi:hypothetical protein
MKNDGKLGALSNCEWATKYQSLNKTFEI